MKSKSFFWSCLVIIMAIAPLIYLAIVWKSLPGIVPVHYDFNFKPDKMGNKSMLWLLNGSLAAVSIAVYFLLINLRRFDPKQRNLPPSDTFRLAIVIVAFITVLNFMFILTISKNTNLLHTWMFPLLGLLFAFIGNYMNNLKPNYFAGLRLPWTLNSDYNWKKTHHLAGKLWFWGGLLAAILSLFLPSPLSIIIFFIILFAIIVIPIIYSYKIFKLEKQNNNSV